MSNRRAFIALLGGAAAAWPLAAYAQQPAKLPTIGFLGSGTPSAWSQWTAALVQRLHELGWIEGRSAARKLGLDVIDKLEIRKPEDVARAFDALKGGAQALYVCGDALVDASFGEPILL
jgi:hypothetical protein